MLVDKTNFGLVLYNQANFYRFEETSSYCLVKRTPVNLCFSLVNQRHTSGTTVYNRTVTNIEHTVRAVHGCNSWLLPIFYFKLQIKSGDHTAEDHTHTDITTCKIEESQQKYRLGKVCNRLRGAGGGEGLTHALLDPNLALCFVNVNLKHDGYS